MKVETTIAIEADLLEKVDDAAKNFRDRSEVFEKALESFLLKIKTKPRKQISDDEETAILNRIADEEREEILETLSYQTDW
jgi:metal-responsive CopG/Arc/MetJ family transcriptional regulator